MFYDAFRRRSKTHSMHYIHDSYTVINLAINVSKWKLALCCLFVNRKHKGINIKASCIP